MRPIGILGGTFDPIHYGHLRLAQELADYLELASVRFIPAGNPYHREAAESSPQARLAMVRLAIAGNPRFVADDREIRRTGPNYTFDTLTGLRAELGNQIPLVLLLGSDAFGQLNTWHRWLDLFSLAHIAVAHRPGHRLDPRRLNTVLGQELIRRRTDDMSTITNTPAGCVTTIAMTPLDISATAIRAALDAGRSARYLLPDAVLDYIQNQRLYCQSTLDQPGGS